LHSLQWRGVAIGARQDQATLDRGDDQCGQSPRAGLRDTDANQARRNEFLLGTKDGVGLWDKAAVNLSAADRRLRDGTTGTEIFVLHYQPRNAAIRFVRSSGVLYRSQLRLQAHFVDDAPEGDPPDLDGARDSGKVPG
jgi:hypothetical protein